jgi:hypothetical protein
MQFQVIPAASGKLGQNRAEQRPSRIARGKAEDELEVGRQPVRRVHIGIASWAISSAASFSLAVLLNSVKWPMTSSLVFNVNVSSWQTLIQHPQSRSISILSFDDWQGCSVNAH